MTDKTADKMSAVLFWARERTVTYRGVVNLNGIMAVVKQLVLDLIPPPQPTLDNFVAGRNGELVSLLREMQGQAATQSVRVVYFWGEEGCGKSHLIRALRALGHHSSIVDADIVESNQSRAIDDVHRLDAAAQQALFNYINDQVATGGVLVTAGIVAPRDLPVRRDLASRLGSGLVFQLHSLTDAEKAFALREHARSRGFPLRDDVIAYLLRHVRRDMPSLMSFLDALDRYSIESSREITLALVREISQPSLG